MQLSPYYEWGKRFAEKCELKSYSQILDLGCREGRLSTFVAERYPENQIMAVDNIAANIDTAQSISTANLTFDIQDALTLPYTNCFDAVVSFHCLLWIANKRQALENVYKALKPGGKCFLQFFVKHGRPQNDRFFYHTAQEVEWKSYFNPFQKNYYDISLEEFCRMIHHIGFLINNLSLVHYPMTFLHAENLQNWLKSWIPHKHIPVSKQEHFMMDVTKVYLEHHQYPQDDSFVYDEYFLEAILEKPSQTPLSHSYQYNELSFTQREAQILKYFLHGKSAKEIAVILPITAKTVEFHFAKIKEKLHCHKRSDIFQAAMTHGFINLMFDIKL